MEDLLKPTRTRLLSSANELVPVESNVPKETENLLDLQSPEDATKGLQSKPDIELLTRILRWLFTPDVIKECINIKLPGPKAAQIINALVNEVLPNYWEIIKESEEQPHIRVRRLLLRSLSSIAGIGALISRLRILISAAQQRSNARTGAQEKVLGDDRSVRNILEVLEAVLRGNNAIANLREDIEQYSSTPSQKSLLWKEIVSVVATGRLLSVSAQANMSLNEHSPDIDKGSWLGDGSLFCVWLGRSINYMISSRKTLFSLRESKDVPLLLSKSLTLGYNDQIIEEVFIKPVLGDPSNSEKYRALFSSLAMYEQKNALYTILRIISQKYLPSSKDLQDNTVNMKESHAIGGLAAFVTMLMNGQAHIQECLIEWLAGSSGGSIGANGNARRAVIAAIASDFGNLENALQKLLSSFGDKLYIKHTPVLHQEVNTQLVLLVSGYVHRSRPTSLIDISRSSTYINAISNRLAASSPRSRFLGIIVGTTVSKVVDPVDKRMTFSSEEIDSDEGRWYQTLIHLNDTVGSIRDLIDSSSIGKSESKKQSPNKKNDASPHIKSTPTSKIISIKEVEDDENETASEDDDLPTYEKPDTDEEDEDEDPTLVQRNKPLAPVYIRDVIAGLRDVENYDRHKLALTTASDLIRRKSKFGTEVTEHIEELATQLVGLGDKYNMEGFQKMRLQAMIAVLLARPLQMGQWFAKTYFNGEYSMGQRASILTTVTMGARELAGFHKEDATLTGADAVPKDSFPSKRLPERLHRIYALDAAPVNALTQRLERTMIQPMAAEAVEKMTGPKALKVRTFSSRMEVEKKRKKAIPNELAKIVGDGFLFPLTGLWRVHLQSYGDRSAHTSPFLLAHFIKTLALLLHASGPSTLSLPQMTTECWSLLLSLRTRAHGDITILEALLFALLTLLDVNEDKRRIAEEHSKELLETQSWVEGVFERIGGGSEEGERVRMLAAGVLVGAREVIDKYQRLLVGEMVGFV